MSIGRLRLLILFANLAVWLVLIYVAALAWTALNH
ncbi:hypothetical protein ACVIWV_006000 [Bradyrhizobium diazoefficiens]|jgi:hypothetical protein|uniref:Uncharacterized protein n=1 Tax=Bradyrhizobium diazoefficiens TaxID=1355477 RepID=A0A0E4G0U5_9BRAD|nr:hypothetical protein NK6_8124 [Bradyrhizobium diazoefficiens]